MTRFDALRALLKKVETDAEFGDDWIFLADDLWPDLQTERHKSSGTHILGKIIDAHTGSLDAAKALHEAVLPGWFWSVDAQGEAEVALVNQSNGLWRVRHSFSAVAYDNPARAWLITVLKALIATEDN